MRRIKKTILSLSLVAAMVMGEAGIALAAEPSKTAGKEAGYEIIDPDLNGATTASVENLNVNVYEWSDSININFTGNGSKFKLYVNNKLYKVIDNTYGTAGADNPAPAMYYASASFEELIKGGTYTIKVVPCSWSAGGDVDGTPVSKTVTTTAPALTKLDVYTYNSRQANGYMVPYASVSWDFKSYDTNKVEIWRKEGKGAWKKLGESTGWSYQDYTVIPGKKYQYRIRTMGAKNTYASVAAGKWLTSKSEEAAKVTDVRVSLDYTNGVDISISNYGDIVSGYEIYRSTNKTKGYKKIATIAGAEYTDNVKSGTYYYKVKAYYYDTNSGKKYYGKLSDAQPIKLIMGNLDVTATQSGKSAAKVEWNKVKGAEKYEVWYKSDVEGDAWKLYKTTTGTNCTVKKLSNDTYYYFRVKAIKGSGSNTYITNNMASCRIGFSSPSVTVAKRKVTAKDAAKKVTIKSTLKWNRVYGASKIRIIGAKDGKEKTLKTLKGTATSYTVSTTVTDKNKGYDYIRVVAIKGKDQRINEVSNSNLVRLNAATKVTVKKSGTGAKISWTAVPGATSYTVYRVNPYENKQSGGDYLTSTTETSYVDENLEPGVNYVYYVYASNSGLGIYNADESARVKYNKKLGTTKITSIKNSAAKKATITWQSAAGAPKYIVYRSTSKNGKYTKVGTTTKTTFTDSKLLKGKTYYYKIKTTGKNAAGFTLTSAYSGVKSVKITK
ncbi:MAG: fibronectin type III domain-containing protein [Clostridium sp.]|nr:fibronectin type III domain-containing protein [Clostridium sp.]MCM1398451.1 fibronectin type III domain-containing protein [Clostridium sp.]MCM1460173.1 fibronectin type III domain-containing protein [Bacteroides sp.]